MARSIKSPGVEIIEKDLSLSPVLPVGTNIFMTGFSQKGPTDEVLQITSLEEFEQVYGIPSNAAERYFYYGASQILNGSTGNLFVSRIPYGLSAGEGYGSTYGALVYPVVSVSETDTVIYRNVSLIDRKYFQNADIINKLAEDSALSLRTTEFSVSGLSAYDKFTQVQYSKFVTAFTQYYDTNISNPALSTLAIETKRLINYLLSGYDTVVSTDLTKDKCTFVLGAPKFFELTSQQYYSVIDGSGFTNSNSTWSASSKKATDILSPADFGSAGLIIVNKIQSTINNRWEGHYIGISDNTNIEPNSDYDSVRRIYTNNGTAPSVGMGVGGMTIIPESKLSFPLSATTDSGNNRSSRSISEALEKVSYSFADMSSESFDDSVSFSLFKLRTSPYNPDAVKLDFIFEEAKAGSFDYYRQINNQNGGIAQSFYLQNVIANSPNISLFVNDNINSKNVGPWLDQVTNKSKRKVRIFSENTETALKNTFESNQQKYGYHLNDIKTIKSYLDYADALFPVASYSTFTTTGKKLGSLTYKIDRILRKIENDEQFDLDLVVEAGLGTIYAASKANKTDYYDDVQVSRGLQIGLQSLITSESNDTDEEDHNIRDNYAAIFNVFDNFCSKLRRDCMFIADPVRHIFVTGANNLTLTDVTKSFSQYIYNPLKHLYETANSSYSTTYGNWVKLNDKFTGSNIWVPFSPFAASTMAETDRNFEPWFAPAGFIRGNVTNALGLAITPKQKERDMLYTISVNPVAFFPNEGFNIFGQKTLLRQPSAFDRINVRRLFLYLEKATKKTVKYFVFEPNTLFTRNRVINTLTPIFDKAKNSQGVYDYQIVCDKRNNTPAVIDQNELVVDIYIKPVRTAEFILVNFYATSTGANFSEFTGQ